MKTAIISVSDKAGVIEFATKLTKLNFKIYSTGGTLKLLKENGISVNSIKDLTQFPEILNGRVKTLHPHVHGGILADRSNKDHLTTCDEHGIKLVDLVVVNLYPFEKTVKNPKSSQQDIIENIDIGGPTLIRAAAKNFNNVSVVISPKRYSDVIEKLKDNNGILDVETKKELAIKAFKHVAEYDLAIANYFDQLNSKDEEALPYYINKSFSRVSELRYGENPHQKAAIYKENNSNGAFINQLHGKELSYNNYIDIESAVSILGEFSLPGAVIIKHTNPCGAAISESLKLAYVNAYNSDTQSAFGSIVGLNRVVDIETAQELYKTFIEVIVAPGFEDEALKILQKKSNLRLLTYKQDVNQTQNLQLRDLVDQLLVQTKDELKFSKENLNCVTTTSPTQKQINDLLFGFALVKHVKSNAILIVKDGKTIGIGAGQMSRVDSVEIALKKAGEESNGACLASDAFFPFKDSIELCAKHNIASIIQPGGSKRDEESIQCCNDNKVSMVFTNTRHFKH